MSGVVLAASSPIDRPRAAVLVVPAVDSGPDFVDALADPARLLETRLVDVAMPIDLPPATLAAPPDLPSIGSQSRPLAPRGPDVFGSLAISAPDMPFARQVRGAFEAPAATVAGCVLETQLNCTTALPAIWRGVIDKARALSGRDQLDWVNRKVNERIDYRDDFAAHGVQDIWSKPDETMASGTGDCEDYAILKMWLLARLGWHGQDMHVVVVAGVGLKLKHAILAVRDGQGTFILDSLASAVRRDVDVTDYKPMLSINASGFWMHGTSPRGSGAQLAGMTDRSR